MSVTHSKVVCDVEFVAVNRNTPWHMPWTLLVMLQPKKCFMTCNVVLTTISFELLWSNPSFLLSYLLTVLKFLIKICIMCMINDNMKVLLLILAGIRGLQPMMYLIIISRILFFCLSRVMAMCAEIGQAGATYCLHDMPFNYASHNFCSDWNILMQ